MKRLFPVLCLCSCLIAAQLFAGSATWSSNPISRDWNTAENWTPQTVPNRPNDIATFNTSAVTKITLTIPFSISINYLASMVFNPGADSFSIHAVRAQNLQISGDGIVNNSGKTQEFVLSAGGSIYFENSASCGDLTNYSVVHGGSIYLFSEATAATAHFTVSDGGNIFFNDLSTADNATFSIGINGRVTMGGSSVNAAFTVAGGLLEFMFGDGGESVIDCSEGGEVKISNSSDVHFGRPHITAHGASSKGRPSGHVSLIGGATADHSTLVIEGGMSALARGASLALGEYSNLQNAEVTVTGGTSGGDGGSLFFSTRSTGGNASITMSGNATLDLSGHDPASGVTVGSLAGEGSVFLGTSELSIGANNLSTAFSGVIQDAGSLTKIGTGTLTLSGETSTYTGVTTVSAGMLLVKNTTGSATGTGPVQVSGGTLSGRGMISGSVTVGTGSGTGAVIGPSQGASNPTTITLQNLLTFKADGSYLYRLNTNKATADQVIANGVTIETGAQFDFNTVGNKKLTTGQVFTAISNTATMAIRGTFTNLADGSTVTLGVNKLQVSYSGGDGNDLTLTVVQ